MFLWWVGIRPTAPTPNLGDQDFLSGLSPLAFSVLTPLLQGNKICNPRQGPLQGAISRSQPNPGFFTRLLLLPLLLSQPDLGPAMVEFNGYLNTLLISPLPTFFIAAPDQTRKKIPPHCCPLPSNR
jgi:hypothetical protein